MITLLLASGSKDLEGEDWFVEEATKRNVLVEHYWPDKQIDKHYDIAIVRGNPSKLKDVVNYADVVVNDPRVTQHYRYKDNQLMAASKFFTVPETLLANNTRSYDFYKSILGHPFVAKACLGSKGNQVFLVNTEKKFKHSLAIADILQEQIKSSYGRDVRVFVIGDRVVASMVRQARGSDFRSNLALGGTATKYDLPIEIQQKCVSLIKDIGYDYAGIDLMFGEKDGEYIFCELNSVPGLWGIQQATNVNVTGLLVEYCINKVKELQLKL